MNESNERVREVKPRWKQDRTWTSGELSGGEGEAPLRHYLREVDAAAVDEIARDYGHVASPERVESMRRNPTVFEDREAFDHALYEVGGRAAGPGERSLGYSEGSERPAHVALDHLEIPATVYHERVHQLAEPGARRVFGEDLDEGVTEDLALRSLGTGEIASAEPCYSEQLEEARQLRAACGESAVESAYFKGDFDELRRCLRDSLPEGRFDELRDRVERMP